MQLQQDPLLQAMEESGVKESKTMEVDSNGDSDTMDVDEEPKPKRIRLNKPRKSSPLNTTMKPNRRVKKVKDNKAEQMLQEYNQKKKELFEKMLDEFLVATDEMVECTANFNSQIASVNYCINQMEDMRKKQIEQINASTEAVLKLKPLYEEVLALKTDE